MSWAAQSYRGPAGDYSFELQSPPDADQLSARQREQVEKAAAMCSTGATAFRPDESIAVTAYGHANDGPGQQGDTLAVTISSVAEVG